MEVLHQSIGTGNPVHMHTTMQSGGSWVIVLKIDLKQDFGGKIEEGPENVPKYGAKYKWHINILQYIQYKPKKGMGI